MNRYRQQLPKYNIFLPTRSYFYTRYYHIYTHDSYHSQYTCPYHSQRQLSARTHILNRSNSLPSNKLTYLTNKITSPSSNTWIPPESSQNNNTPTIQNILKIVKHLLSISVIITLQAIRNYYPPTIVQSIYHIH